MSTLAIHAEEVKKFNELSAFAIKYNDEELRILERIKQFDSDILSLFTHKSFGLFESDDSLFGIIKSFRKKATDFFREENELRKHLASHKKYLEETGGIFQPEKKVLLEILKRYDNNLNFFALKEEIESKKSKLSEDNEYYKLMHILKRLEDMRKPILEEYANIIKAILKVRNNTDKLWVLINNEEKLENELMNLKNELKKSSSANEIININAEIAGITSSLKAAIRQLLTNLERISNYLKTDNDARYASEKISKLETSALTISDLKKINNIISSLVIYLLSFTKSQIDFINSLSKKAAATEKLVIERGNMLKSFHDKVLS